MAPRRSVGISGVAVAFAALGGYMIYAGIRNVGTEGGRFDPIGGLRDLLSGRRPPSRSAGAYDPPGRSLGAAVGAAISQSLPTGPVPISATTIVHCRGPIGSGAVNPTIRVHTAISAQVDRMLGDAFAAGVRLCGSGWRSTLQQRALRLSHGYFSDSQASGSGGRTPVAVPGQSRHEFGLAIDFASVTTGAAIRAGSPEHNWLTANAGRYGFRQLPSESWHWSTDGH